MILPQPAHKIIPHRDSMLLIDTLVSATPGKGQAEVTLPDTCVAADESGELSPLIFVELIAQTNAAVKGWELTQAGDEHGLGFLVGVQKFEVLGTGFVEKPLVIIVESVGEFEGFIVVEGRVSCNDTILAKGKIKLWVSEEENA